VKAEFRNVMFHLTPTAAAHLEAVTGELLARGQIRHAGFRRQDFL
jgi:hypothetical protein